MKEVIIVRGVSGSGKSTFAKLLASAHNGKIVENDKFAYNDQGEYDWKAEDLHKYFYKAKKEFEKHVDNEEPMIIVSNVSVTWKSIKGFFKYAKEHGYKVTSLVLENRNETTNIHDVPDDVLEGLRENFEIKL